MDQKQFLRKTALTLRKKLVSQNKLSEISDCIAEKILNSTEFKNAKNIALYYPLKDEVDITKIIKNQNKNFYFPRCREDNLEFVKYTSFDDFKSSKFNLKEPIGESVDVDIIDLIYVPALVASKNCCRIGWGKGYYDRFFNKFKPRAKKIIIAPKLLVLDELIPEEHDVQCDLLICED